MSLELQDYTAVGVALLFAASVGAIVQTLNVHPLQFENMFRWVTGAAVLISLVFVYKGAALWGGDVARALTMIGTGFSIFMLQWVPHIGWHMDAAAQGQPVTTLLGLNGHFVLGFFHALTAASFLLVSYGFYLFYESGSKSK